MTGPCCLGVDHFLLTHRRLGLQRNLATGMFMEILSVCVDGNVKASRCHANGAYRCIILHV